MRMAARCCLTVGADRALVTAFFFNVVVAHGRFDLPRESSGRMR
jgi:hypothetical protein